jgi:DNA-binding transcriptional LysR family regulator
VLDWNDLRYALAIGRHGSLSKAARALGVHQTTVGRRLEALEATLGSPLFLRTPRGLLPAPDSARLLGSIEALAGSLSRFEASLQDHKDEAAGLVRLALTENTARLLLRDTLAAFSARHPGIALELLPANTLVDVAAGDADIAVRVVAPEGADLVVRKLGVVRYGLYGGLDYVRRHPGPIRGALAGHAVLLPSRELARGPEGAWLSEHAAAARVALHSSSLVTLALAAEAGMGLTVLPTNLAALHPGLSLLRRLPEIPERPVWIVTHRQTRRLPRIRAVAAAVSERLTAVLRDG